MELMIDISTEAVMREIYALTALKYVTKDDRRGEARPALLTRGHEELLTEVVADQFAMMAAELVALLVDVDTERLQLIMSADRMPVLPSAIRRALEHVLAIRVMAEAHSGEDAERYAADATKALETVKQTLRVMEIPRRCKRWL